MGIDSAYLIYGSFILALGAAIGAGLQALYQREFNAAEKQREKGSIKLAQDDLITLHWLATNGFRRLLLLRERGSGGFQTRERAEEAHWTLDRLENHLPKDAVTDASFNRMGDIAMHWPDGPLSPARRLLKQQRLDKEP